MVIDTSALIAVLFGEGPRSAVIDEVAGAATRLVSSVSVLETGIVLRARLGSRALRLLTRLLEELGIETVAFDADQAHRAIAAFGRYGKGMGHAAQLNFGDCAVYALAELRRQPILAAGDDFAATDMSVVRV